MDRSESINQHMNFVNLTPIDIPKKTFEVEDNLAFDSSKLYISCDKKKKKKMMTNAVIKMFKKIAHVSNSSIV